MLTDGKVPSFLQKMVCVREGVPRPSVEKYHLPLHSSLCSVYENRQSTCAIICLSQSSPNLFL